MCLGPELAEEIFAHSLRPLIISIITIVIMIIFINIVLISVILNINITIISNSGIFIFSIFWMLKFTGLLGLEHQPSGFAPTGSLQRDISCFFIVFITTTIIMIMLMNIIQGWWGSMGDFFPVERKLCRSHSLKQGFSWWWWWLWWWWWWWPSKDENDYEKPSHAEFGAVRAREGGWGEQRPAPAGEKNILRPFWNLGKRSKKSYRIISEQIPNNLVFFNR